jgi:hypothetical protein
MAPLSMNLLGYAQGNAQMKVEVWDPATNLKIAEAPSLADGTVRFPNIATGAYVVRVRHPNLVSDVATQTVYVAAAGETRVTTVINPQQFTNLAIADIPDVDLEPLAKMAQSVELAAGALANKMPGELLTAAWANGIALAIRDLAHAVTALSRSVTPVGHNHVEYENKIGEMSTNFQNLVQTLAESTVQMQRRFDIQTLRSRIEDVFEVTTVAPQTRTDVLKVLTAMEANINESPQVYSQRMRAAATLIQTTLKDTIKNLPTAAAPIAAAYKAVIEVWATRSVNNLVTEMSQPKLDVRNLAFLQVEATNIQGDVA